MKREDLRIGQVVEVNMVGKVTSIGTRIGVKRTNNNNPFGIDDAEVKAEFVEAFEPDAEDEAVTANSK